ncbi:MAG: hypothetical protein HOG05_16420 [Bacteroidetes bacterium]|jgi:hypothetical protein|nr:hypothetical protein [Bacteroidota bacterium]
MDSIKVFAIGISRTGTTSLTKAMELLGYKCNISLNIITNPGE